MVGEVSRVSVDDICRLVQYDPPDLFDFILRTALSISSVGSIPVPSPWIKRVTSDYTALVSLGNPPSRFEFRPTERLTQDRLNTIIDTVPEGFLTSAELDLMVYIVDNCQQAIAWSDSERGTFSREYFPDYEMPVIEHTPWVRAPIPVPRAIEGKVREMLRKQMEAGKYEYSSASY
ncbi:hypothetical protein IEO21_10295 [Rhodonia placenta]|uniref:Uncharacterized protein n=1 Tax=Rhodonia placenta TaxID=104341 RepID=A0A8H7NSR7_9APHY|nr:hypothetical protein IEO21_10295 [Postia placenta]